MRLIITITLGILLVLVIVPCTAEDIPENPELWLPNNEVFSYREPSEAKNPAQANTMIGKSSHHRVEKDETLLDIARRYHLGYQEMVHANPGVDPWVPIVGEESIYRLFGFFPGSDLRGLSLTFLRCDFIITYRIQR